MAGFRGRPVGVTVGPAKKPNPEQLLVQRVRDVLLGRKVTNVRLEGEQLILKLNDGGSVAFNCAGGIREVS
jgi:hypothetical protein